MATIFIMQIGKTLRSGKKHDGRAPDYDDWELNGDIIFYNPLLGRAPLRCRPWASASTLRACVRQLTSGRLRGAQYAAVPPVRCLSGELPLTIGGGIGQSRLCMLLHRLRAHRRGAVRRMGRRNDAALPPEAGIARHVKVTHKCGFRSPITSKAAFFILLPAKAQKAAFLRKGGLGENPFLSPERKGFPREREKNFAPLRFVYGLFSSRPRFLQKSL